MDRIDLNLEAHPSYYGLEVFKDPDHQFLSSKLQTTSSSSSSSIPCYLFSSLTHDQGRYYCYESQQVGLEQEGGSVQHSLTSWSEKNEEGNKDDRADHISAHWISSNKSLRSDKDQSNNAMKLPTETMMPILGNHNKQMTSLKSDNNINSSSNITVRVCSDCHTTKTPLWRSGPKGPKSLCNACGIRQRKARRAMAAAANGTVVATTIVKSLKSKGQHKEHKPRTKPYMNSKFKKKCKPLKASACSSSGGKAVNKLCFEDFIRISLRKHSAFHRFFPQDEKEAAILLMALSSGLVHG